MAIKSEPDAAWHLDKRIPLGIIFALFVQTITLASIGVYWKSSVDFRLSALEQTDLSRSSNSNKILILEQQFINIQHALDRIEIKMDKKFP